MLGALFAFLAAASFGFTVASARRGVLTGTLAQSMGVSVLLGPPMFGIAAVLTGQINAIGDLNQTQWLLLSSVGIIHFIAGRYCAYRSLRAMGATLSGAVGQLQLIYTVSLALMLLGETLTVLKVLGLALTMGGSAITLYGRNTKSNAAEDASNKKSSGFVPNYVEGYVFGLLSVLGYGTSPILISAALEGSGNGILAGFVAYLSAAVVIIVWLAASRRNWRQVFSGNAAAFRWFFVAGVAVNVSHFFSYISLGLAPVTVVTPIMNTGTVFRLLFSWFLNRGYEIIDLRVIIGVALALVGGALMPLDATQLAQWLGLTEAVARVLAFSWPQH